MVLMSTQPKALITEAQYLEIEKSSEVRNEFFQREMFPMEASISHTVINGNVFVILTRELAGSECRPFTTGLRIRVAATGLYAYPDVVVVCGKPEVSDRDKDSVINPSVLVEILSPTTENYDRGRKFVQYRSIPSFREYLLFAQDRMHVEHHVRQADGGWLLHETSDGDATVYLKSVGGAIHVARGLRRRSVLSCASRLTPAPVDPC